MTGTFRVTLFFESLGYGWSETYAFLAPNYQTFQQIHDKGLLPMINARAALMPAQVVMTYSRISTWGVKNQVLLTYENNVGNYPGGFEDQGQPEFEGSVNTALLVKFQPTTPGPSKNVYLRGLPEEVVDAGLPFYTPNWLKLFNVWIRTIYNSTTVIYGWIGVQSKLQATVNTYAWNANKTVSITVNQAIFNAIAPGTKIVARTSGINGKSVLNGTNVFYVQSGTVITTKDEIAVQPYQSGGLVTLPTWGFTTILTGNGEKIMSRKAGRAAFLERGRQPVKARL
jgi:hypothetical protein